MCHIFCRVIFVNSYATDPGTVFHPRKIQRCSSLIKCRAPKKKNGPLFCLFIKFHLTKNENVFFYTSKENKIKNWWRAWEENLVYLKHLMTRLKKKKQQEPTPPASLCYNQKANCIQQKLKIIGKV